MCTNWPSCCGHWRCCTTRRHRRRRRQSLPCAAPCRLLFWLASSCAHRSRRYSQLIVDELRAKTSAALPTPLAFSARDVAVALWAAAALSLQLDVALVGNLLAIFDQHAVSARSRRRRRRARTRFDARRAVESAASLTTAVLGCAFWLWRLRLYRVL